MNEIQNKFEHLKTILREMESVIVGYSGGVDSTFLAKAAADILGANALAVAAISESYPIHERKEAEEYAKQLGLNFITVETSEIDNPEYRKNDANRCYHCKHDMITHLKRIAKERKIKHIIIGTNTDDLGDHRPGQQAAQENGVRSPLVEAGFSKEDIRALSKELNIPTWNKPSFACLASRLPYGDEITREKLAMVEKAENALRELGFRQFRVRHHNDLARIEVLPEEMLRLMSIRENLTRMIKNCGYTYVTMDLLGYRTGSMNETLFKT